IDFGEQGVLTLEGVSSDSLVADNFRGFGRIFEGDGDDVAEGTDGDDALYGFDGNDILGGGAGDDVIS
ncbi:MAG TPA: hemolysin expression modulating protein, partial [Thalassospira sp.]|nr:hemolysin expression modulating protein [Thalassospira sp.]